MKLRSFIKHIPNVLSLSRIIVSVILVFVQPFTTAFYVLYAYCGLSDVLDGFLARRFSLTSEFGARIDSIADIVFVLVCFAKILPCLTLPTLVLVWVFVIAFVKTFGYVLCSVRRKSSALHHTATNKITGIFLFCVPFFMNFPYFFYVEILLCCLATFATLQEFYLIVTAK